MLVHVKTPHTEIDIKGDVSEKIMEVQNDKYIDPFETDWFNEVKEPLSPGDYLKTDRENKGITQNDLDSEIGRFSRQYVSDLEHGRKNISSQGIDQQQSEGSLVRSSNRSKASATALSSFVFSVTI
ncbi:MAG: hypothetical protein B6241_11655 [Spirochaetaceae bacterium 4572_59]|nr:MAG: hypothetical protein B6241_11655 [Spirochaetaceae bacterium 4572_59]